MTNQVYERRCCETDDCRLNFHILQLLTRVYPVCMLSFSFEITKYVGLHQV